MNNKRKQIIAAIFIIILSSIPAFAACDSKRGKFFPDGSLGNIHQSVVNPETLDNSVAYPDALFQSFRPRQYNPQLGRFMQRDPLGVVPNAMKPNEFKPKGQYQDGTGLYVYAKSNLLMNFDSYGLSAVYICLGLIEIGDLGKLLNDPYISCLNEGYYRHCVNNCILNRLIGPLPSFLIALGCGNDFPWQNPEIDDIKGDLKGIDISYGLTTCKSECLKAYDNAVKESCCPDDPTKKK